MPSHVDVERKVRPEGRYGVMAPDTPASRFELALDKVDMRIMRILDKIDAASAPEELEPELARLEDLKLDLEPTDTERVAEILGGDV